MAKLSRNARGKARVRRNLSLMGREYRKLQAAHFNTHLTLLMVLAQSGGELTVTQGTMQQTVEQIKTLNWQSGPGVTPNEFVVRLVVNEAVPTTGPTSISEMARLDEEPVTRDFADEPVVA